jgi:RNA polymerase sigma-70 factor (ECF subfamily)
MPPGSSRLFIDTHWSVVLRAKSSHTERLQALETLFRTYSKPLSFLIEHTGFATHEVDDLLQEFYLTRILLAESLDKVHPDKGRFRCYLTTLLRNFLKDEWDRRNAKKRQFLNHAERMDEPDEQGDPLRQYASTTLSVEEQIDRVWARQIFDNAMARLRGECAGLGKAHLFDRVSSYLHEDLENCSWDGIAAELGMNAGTVRTAATRIKQRWKFLIREEVRQTVADEKEWEAELAYLVSLMGR